MMRYDLSRNQQRELNNDKRLQIALPLPPHGADWSATRAAQWARSVLPDYREEIEQVLLEDIEVDPTLRPDGFSLAVGSIVRGYRPFTILVRCVVVRLCSAYRPRSTYPVQWPGRCEIDGQIYGPMEG